MKLATVDVLLRYRGRNEPAVVVSVRETILQLRNTGIRMHEVHGLTGCYIGQNGVLPSRARLWQSELIPADVRDLVRQAFRGGRRNGNDFSRNQEIGRAHV